MNRLELAQLVEFGEAEACADMQLAAAVAMGTHVERIGSAIALVASQIPIMLFNRVAGLGLRSTLPSHRRRGGQGALMARRIQDGAALGCKWLVTETGEDLPERPNPSYHNMLRTGFALAYQRINYFPSR